MGGHDTSTRRLFWCLDSLALKPIQTIVRIPETQKIVKYTLVHTAIIIQNNQKLYIARDSSRLVHDTNTARHTQPIEYGYKPIRHAYKPSGHAHHPTDTHTPNPDNVQTKRSTAYALRIDTLAGSKFFDATRHVEHSHHLCCCCSKNHRICALNQ